MQNNTKKAIMLGALLLGCGLTSLLGSLLGSNNKPNVISEERNLLMKEGKGYLGQAGLKGAQEARQGESIKIYVSGAVLQPGLYDIPRGSRADDAVKAAGGMLETADTERVNLAKLLKDGMQVNVPFRKGKSSYAARKQSHGSKSGEAGYNLRGNSFEQQELDAEGVVNLNTASAAELETLPGIGPSMAQRIIEHRQHSRFQRVEDLLKVPGIGRAKLARLQGRLCV